MHDVAFRRSSANGILRPRLFGEIAVFVSKDIIEKCLDDMPREKKVLIHVIYHIVLLIEDGIIECELEVDISETFREVASVLDATGFKITNTDREMAMTKLGLKGRIKVVEKRIH
jgi:hypothetical protein